MVERYGTHRPRRRWLLVAISSLVAIVALGWLAWAAWSQANPAIQAAVASFDIKNQHRIDATVEIRLHDPSVTGDCLLRATARDHSVVGELSFPVARASTARDRVFHLRTERLATTVEVVRCTADKH